jgi:adenosylcobinamide-GDP ribazoletransferase
VTLSDDSSSGTTRSGICSQLRLAINFLTIVPIRIGPASDADVAASMAWFPFVGLLMGIAYAVEDRVLSYLLPHAIRSAIIVLSMTILTGAVHLDGLADTADALGGGVDRARALEILRDSRIGAFGAIALFFVLALKLVSIATVFGKPRFAMLLLAPMLSRWAMVAVSYHIDYLRASGAGSAMLGRDGGRNLAIPGIVAFAAIIPFFSRRAIAAYVIAIIASFMMRRFYRRWLGGITGDLIGACGEIVEVLAMIILAS